MLTSPKLWLLIALTFAGSAAQAHPHVTIEQSLGLVFDNKGLSGFLVKWRFDYFYSAAAADSYDQDRDEKLTADETATVKQELFDPILSEGGVIFVRVDGVKKEVGQATGYAAEFKNGALWMTFFVPCQISLDGNVKELVIETFDPTYYNEIVFSKTDPAFARDAGGYTIKTSLRQSADTAYYFDQIHPWALVAELKKKP